MVFPRTVCTQCSGFLFWVSELCTFISCESTHPLHQLFGFHSQLEGWVRNWWWDVGAFRGRRWPVTPDIDRHTSRRTVGAGTRLQSCKALVRWRSRSLTPLLQIGWAWSALCGRSVKRDNVTAVRPSAGSSNTHRVSLCCQDEANQREELDCWTSSVISVISHRLHLPLVVFFKLVSMLMALCTPLCLTGSCTLHPSTITDGYEETSTHSQFS